WSKGNDGPARCRSNNPRDVYHGAYRSCCRSGLGRYGAAAERSSDLREPAGRDAANAGCTDRRRRSPAQGGQDEDGVTLLAYNDPQWLTYRHGVDAAGLDRTLHAM